MGHYCPTIVISPLYFPTVGHGDLLPNNVKVKAIPYHRGQIVGNSGFGQMARLTPEFHYCVLMQRAKCRVRRVSLLWECMYACIHLSRLLWFVVTSDRYLPIYPIYPTHK